MKEFIISTDSVTDLSREYLEVNEIDIHSIDYMIEGKEYSYDNELMPLELFYNAIRSGNLPKTSASNPYKIKQRMQNQLMKGYDILHISFSGALSSSYNNTVTCANELMQEIEGSNIIVIDSLSATVGLDLLVNQAVNMKKDGISLKEVSKWIEDNKCKVIHQFVVKDLFHLVKGGRLTNMQAFVGTQLKIRPILTLNSKGAIVMKKRERGHKRALNFMVDNMCQQLNGETISTVYISHADELKDAEYIANRIRNQYEVENIIISTLNATVGAHTGADSVVLAYFGSDRL